MGRFSIAGDQIAFRQRMQLLDRTQMPLERSRKRLHDLGWSALKTGQLRVTSVLFRARLLGALIERALVADALDELVSASFKLTVDLAQTPRDPDLLSRRRLGQAALALSTEIALSAMVSGLIFYAAAYWLCLFALRSMPASVAGATSSSTRGWLPRSGSVLLWCSSRSQAS